LSQSAKQYMTEAIKHYNADCFQEALAALEQALSIDPVYIKALHGKGVVLAKMKEYQKAVDVLSKACELAPANGKIHLDLAEAYYVLGDYIVSGSVYRKAAQLDNNYKPVYLKQTQKLFYKAIALRGQGMELRDEEEALKAFQQVLLFNPSFDRASEYISELTWYIEYNYPESEPERVYQSGYSSTWNNEWPELPLTTHPFNCRCPQCWEP